MPKVGELKLTYRQSNANGSLSQQKRTQITALDIYLSSAIIVETTAMNAVLDNTLRLIAIIEDIDIKMILC